MIKKARFPGRAELCQGSKNIPAKPSKPLVKSMSALDRTEDSAEWSDGRNSC